MKFLVVCLFAILGAAVAKPVEGDQVKVKEPVPLIVSDYSSVVKDDASSSVDRVVPAAVAEVEAPVAVPDAVKSEETESTEASTQVPTSDEKEFAEEVKQEEKLLKADEEVAPVEEAAPVAEQAAASAVDEVRQEQEAVVEPANEDARAEVPAEDAPVTTEASFSEEVKEAEPVVADARTVDEAVDAVKAEEPVEESKPVEEAKPAEESDAKSDDVVPTTVEPSADEVKEFVPAQDPASRVVREVAESAQEDNTESAPVTDAVESRTEADEEVTTEFSS